MSNLLKDMHKVFILLALISTSAVFGWVDPQFVEGSFKSALEVFRGGDYQSSHKKFTSLLMDSRGTEHYSMTKFMVALSSYRDGNWEASAREFGDYVRSFPEYPISATARLYQGNAYFFMDDYINATEVYLASAKLAGDDMPKVAANAMQSSSNLLWGYLTDDQIMLLAARLEGSSGQIVDFYRVKRFQFRGENRRALELCNRSLETRAFGVFSDSLKVLANTLKNAISEKINILVLAPTEGAYAEYGNNIVNGVKMAVDRFSREKRINIAVITENTAADPLVAAYACKTAIAKNSPIAVIGPLLSDVAVPVAIYCDHEHVPLILPTASKDGLSGISPFVFQLSSPPSVGAKTLAHFAFDSLAVTRFSALAPDDPIGRKAVDLFVKEVEALNCEMLSVAYYAEGTIDFSEHLQAIKKPYFDEAKRFFPHADTTDTRFYKPNHSMRNEEEWIVDIPGFFVPAYYDDLVNIIPQVPFNYIRPRFLGENGWIIDQLKTMNGSQIDSAVVVPDDFWVDEGSSIWTSFSKEYKKSFGVNPDRIAALGFDSAKLILRGIDKGLITPEQQRDFLSATNDFSGTSGDISFDEMGTNFDVSLVRFNRNIPEKIR
ncbi:ABC transporter substrate-binding protein [bacterium]|nr:ABC transporter substrate-binding protein [bacterium]